MKQQIVVRTEVFREGDLYVALCPDLDVSSFGETIKEVRHSLDEALAAFIEECEEMGSLADVLEEAGFARKTSPHQVPGTHILTNLVGKPRVCFNAHRIHTPQQVLDFFPDLTLMDFSAVDDGGNFRSPANPDALTDANYACGLFHFIKQS